MGLMAGTFWIAFKRSGRRLLILACVLFTGAGLLWACMGALPEAKPPQKARVAVVNEDSSPLLQEALHSLVGEQSLPGLVELELTGREEAASREYTAVITLPEGFLQSILEGTNLPPAVEIRPDSPVAAVWIRQLLRAGTRALTAAQQGIYAIEKAAGEGMRESTYQLLVYDVNIKLIQAFLERLTLLEEEKISAGGGLRLPEYYLCALCCALIFSYGFLYRPIVHSLRCFGLQSGRRVTAFLAGWAHCLLLSLLLSLLAFWGLGRLAGGETAGMPTQVLQFSLLICGYSMCISAVPTASGAAAASILGTVAMGLLGGLFMPPALLPAAVSKFAALFPFTWGVRLLSACVGAPVAGWLAPAVIAGSLLLTGIGAIPFFKPKGRGA